MSESMLRKGTRSAHRLLIFARAPEEGKVKTRLSRAIGTAETTAIYEAMIREMMDRIGSGDTFDVEVLWTASADLPGETLVDTFRPHRLARQIGRDLGERMTVAFSERALLQRTTRIIAIGTDLPDLDRSDIDSAFALLASCDWVIGPATDGGYYLIGCRATSFDARVFDGIRWGDASVLESTIERIRELGETVALLPKRRDIDHADDLFDYVERHPDGEVARAVQTTGARERSMS